jgi:hypothetical protein
MATATTVVRGLKPFVTDRRNLLLIHPLVGGVDDPFLKSLGYALRRAIQTVFQIEESELAVELIGSGSRRSILFWEAAEGGIGIADRMADEPTLIRAIAEQALRVVHVDPASANAESGWTGSCGAACYACLLSYTNQLDHRLLDRRPIVPFLRELYRAQVRDTQAARSYDEHYQWLIQRLDTASSLEARFLAALFMRRLRLPDRAQYVPTSDVPVQADFYYAAPSAPGACVFVDGPVHEQPGQAARDQAQRDALRARGFHVIAIRHGRDLEAQIGETPDIFTPA